MVMRVGGLASGMDIDALVEKLMNAERAPLNKLQQKKTTYEWQRDAYRDVSKNLKTFDTYVSDNLVLKSFNSKTASTSNSSLVSATATGTATGSLTLEGVSQLATAARGIGTQINADGATKVSSLFGNGTAMPTEIKLGSIDKQGKLGEQVSITLDENMTVSQLVSKINSSNAGVSAIFEGGRLSITAKNTGREINGNDAITADANGLDLFRGLGLNQLVTEQGTNAVFQVNGIATERTSNSFEINGYNVTLNSTFNSERTTAEKYNAAFTEWRNTTSATFEASLLDAANKKATAEAAYTTAEATLNSAKTAAFGSLTEEQMAAVKKVSSENLSFIHSGNLPNFITEEEYNSWLNATTNTTEEKTALKKANLSFEELSTLKSLTNGEITAVKNQKAYDSLGNSFLAGLTANERALISTAGSDLSTKISEWGAEGNTDETQVALAKKLNALNDTQKDQLSSLTNTQFDAVLDVADKTVAFATATQEKNIKVAEHSALVNRQSKALADFKAAYNQQFGNDANFDPNNYVNAQSIDVDAMPSSSAAPVNLSSTSNTDEMMDKVKEFVNKYNELIKGLNDQLKQSKYRDYQPLTTEQKEEMSENEIKLWEEKAKSGLLRNDSIIRNGISSMRSLVYETNHAVEDTRFNSLYSIGITTSKSYNDGGTLEIDEAKLRKALEENPDAVETLLKNTNGKKDDTVQVYQDGQLVSKTADTRGYIQKLRDSLKTFEVNIEKKAGRTTMTDSQYSIGKSILDTDKRIDTWQDKLKSIEARYWKQFTAMETAINKSNQQSSIFAQG